VADQESLYQVDRAPLVPAQIRVLAAKAAAQGMEQEFLHALQAVVHHLQDNPVEWGDPEYRTKKSGGLVCHGIHWPLHIQYAVYEAERVVFILKIKGLPGSQLE
jgi:hypothetical protein